MTLPARVVIAYHSFGTVHSRFCFSLARAIAYEGGRIERVMDLQSPYVEDGRNKLVSAFLAGTKAEFMLMMDADIEFEADAISKTMAVAENYGAAVVWGNYALGTGSNSIFTKSDDSEWGILLINLKPNMVYSDIYAGGTGWCLIRRELLERMQKEYPGPWHWFPRDIVPGPGGTDSILGEDLGFGRRVSKMNVDGKRPLQVGYTGVRLIHHKFHATVPQFMLEVMPDAANLTAVLPPENQPALDTKALLATATPEIIDPSTLPPTTTLAEANPISEIKET